MTDEDLRADVAPVRAFWEELGLPGLIDAHAHFLPPNIQRAVWAQFDQAGPKIGRAWPIRYRVSDDERISLLREMGVRRFSTLPYAHKPGVASYLNSWSKDLAEDIPEVIWSATFYPEPGVADYVRDLVDAGVEIFKLHLQVGEFHLDDPLLDGVWGPLEDAGIPVLVHAGSGPVGNAHTGPASSRRLLSRHPTLSLVIAHMGAPERAEFLDFAADYEHLRLDTSMAFTDFFDSFPGPDEVARLADLGHKIIFGSDFPTLPFPYAHQLEGLARLDLGDHWLRQVCWENGAALFGLPRSSTDTLPV